MLVLRAVTALVLAAALAPAAHAASVAYVDGNEVWVAALDGTQKARLSDGEGDWRAVTAADNGRVLGVRLEAGKIAQLSRMQLWEKDGTVLSQGPLPYKNRAWSSYAAPLSPDLSADGVFLAYGYSGYTGIVPSATFYRGHNVVLADTKTLVEPIGQEGYEWPTMVGRRVVAASGSAVMAQAPGGEPFGTTWNPLLDAGPTGLDLQRTDVAANGSMLALELVPSGSGPGRIGLIAAQGIDAPVAFPAAVDCYLPAAGNATDPSLSQDGKWVAWKDDEGVKVAGTPTTAADPCVLASPPVLVSATGKSPSIGGSDVATLRPPAPAPAAPGGGGGGGGGTTTGPAPAATPVTPAPAAPPVLALTLPARLSAAGLARGVTVSVRAPAAGLVKVVATVPARRLGRRGAPVRVASGSARATGAGPLRVKLRLTAAARKRAKRLKGARLTLRVTQGARTATKAVTLR
ncbi:MAG: hypothetical protein HZB46_05595 [Solirubrobacterales bacterium]|nr:hypothetical protein [Solirubrobacterales bacterium]